MRRKFLIRAIKKSFECQRCNLCCMAPGFVFLSAKEAGRIAAYLKLEYEAFIAKYCRHENGNLVLIDKPGSPACIFLEKDGCSIHPVKPRQCREFPRVWREPDAFDYCEGIKKLDQGMDLKT